MKNGYFILIAFYFLCSGLTVQAQIDLPEGTLNALEKYNQDQAEKEDSDSEKNKTAEQKKKEQQWKKEWEDAKDAAKEGMDYFDTKELNCLFLMVLYLDSYFQLEDEAEANANCDLYGLQATAIALSTTIMYCPEHLYNLSDADFEDLVNKVRTIGKTPFGDKMLFEVNPWFKKYFSIIVRMTKNLYNSAPDSEISPDEYEAHFDFPFWQMVRQLTTFFRPDYIVNKSVAIARKMEALGCDDY
ncbi:MAG: hypothetical protein HKO68_07720 [Desulfobacterales bacterium]|nr:hypothetical protein [Desulfobacterales bacterium]